MKHRLLTLSFALIVALAPIVALAKEDEDTVRNEGRIEGYTTAVRLPDSGTALTWLLTMLVSAMLLAALLKNAKRTHLD